MGIEGKYLMAGLAISATAFLFFLLIGFAIYAAGRVRMLPHTHQRSTRPSFRSWMALSSYCGRVALGIGACYFATLGSILVAGRVALGPSEKPIAAVGAQYVTAAAVAVLGLIALTPSDRRSALWPRGLEFLVVCLAVGAAVIVIGAWDRNLGTTLRAGALLLTYGILWLAVHRYRSRIEMA